jgi:integrase
VKDKPGIYVRQLADGAQKYEIAYVGSDGRRRWQMIPGGVRDAERERRRILAEIDKGGKVEPNRDTFAAVADQWLKRQTKLRPRTLEWYEIAIRVHLVPRLGSKRLAEIDADAVADLIASMEAARYAAWTIRGVLTPLGRILDHAARKGWVAANPVGKLEKDERPAEGERREMRILDRDEIVRLIEATDARYRALIATAVFTGLRQGELLGLTWEDVDLDAGLLRVRKQLDRKGRRVEPKTKKAVREVVLMPALTRMLREHKLASPYSREWDFVFASERGTALHYRNIVRRGLEPALKRAGLDGKPKLRWHDLRHTYASLLIAEGEDVVWVSRQLGHANPSVTLNVYADLFDRRKHADRMRSRMEAGYGSILDRGEHDGEHGAPSQGVPAAPAQAAEVAQLHAIGTPGD